MEFSSRAVISNTEQQRGGGADQIPKGKGGWVSFNWVRKVLVNQSKVDEAVKHRLFCFDAVYGRGKDLVWITLGGHF